MRKILFTLMALALVLGLVIPAALATTVTPTEVPGNPTCPSCGFQVGFKVDPPNAGTYTVPGFGTITITTDGTYFDWTSTFGISAVLVKGGNAANLYTYNPPAYSFGDTDLHAPINASGGPAGLSHIDFCYDEGARPVETVTVLKTAETTFTRTWNWTIDKSVSPETWNLFTGDSGTSEYTVAVTKTGYTDSAWAVSGNITIMNTGIGNATITGISDVVSPAIAATVDCGVTFPYVLEASENLTCTYSADLPDGTQRLNTANVTTEALPAGYNGYADVIFGEPTTVVNDTINVDDTNGGSWPFSDSGNVTYERTFACDGDKGTHDNTATIVETGQYGNATVTVTCYPLQVRKNAHTSFTRTWGWTIDKSGNETALTLSAGQQSLVGYKVTGNATYTDSNWAVSGNITVYNPAPIPATINDVSDIVSPAIAATVDFGVIFPYTLAAGGTLEGNYTASLPDASQRVNTGNATLQNYDYDKNGTPTEAGTTDFSGSAAVDFASATINKVDECIAVTDDQKGLLGRVCADQAPYTFNYSMLVGNYTACGEYKFTNIASFVTNDTQAAGNDTWTVTITVPCPGCTLTPGYWKTHSERGPAPYDDTWALLSSNGANTGFFFSKSGQSYYQVLWTAPKGGNAYYILAHAYIAAKLNRLNGASIPPAVLSAFNQATTLFNTYTPAQIGALKGNNGTRATFISLAGILDAYNNGITGPGHCDE